MTAHKGFTLVEIMIVVAIISLLAALAIPSFARSRQDSRRTACLNNLRLISHSKQQLAIASQSMLDSYVPAMSELSAYFTGQGTPFCREGGSYTVNEITNNPTCSQSMAPFLHVMVNDIR